MVHTKIWNYYKSCTKSWAIFQPVRLVDVPFRAGFGCLFRPECSVATFCAGIATFFRPKSLRGTLITGRRAFVQRKYHPIFPVK